MQNQPKNSHLPVLAEEVIECLRPKKGESYLDLTAGYGGHARKVLALTVAPGKSLLVDRDEQAISALKQELPQVTIWHSDFLSACQKLVEESKNFDMIFADLGISSPHIDIPDRGFSLSHSGPLDMRMDRRQELTAEKLVNDSSEEQLARLLREGGEEAEAHKIARAIISHRPLKTTDELARVIAKTAGPTAKLRRIHPATRAFQALRIAVNDELEQLAASLPLMEKLLAPGGRLAIISFHSLEDRLVKQFLADRAGDGYDAEMSLITKKPLRPTEGELLTNPRARSARLRAAVKIKK